MTYNEDWEEVERWNCRNDHHDLTDEEQDRELWEPRHRFMSIREMEDVD